MGYFNTSKYKHTSRENRFSKGLKGVVLTFVDTKKPPLKRK